MVELETIAGPDWSGWSFDDGQLYAPEWRRGLTPGDIRSLPFYYALAADRDREARELAEVKRQLAAAIRLAGFYRRNLILEARLGLMFSRM